MSAEFELTGPYRNYQSPWGVVTGYRDTWSLFNLMKSTKLGGVTLHPAVEIIQYDKRTDFCISGKANGCIQYNSHVYADTFDQALRVAQEALRHPEMTLQAIQENLVKAQELPAQGQVSG